MDRLTRRLLSTTVQRDSHWLDLGCGLRPFESSFLDAHYTAIDVEDSGRSAELKKPDCYFDGQTIPYSDGSFDGILCTQVLEHVENPDALLPECNRVLKDKGHFVVSVPFAFREHEQPNDFRRFTSYGLQRALSNNGFEQQSCFKCLSASETVATLFSVYLNNNVAARSRFLVVAVGALVTTPLLLFSSFLSSVLPDNGDLYCTLIVSAVKRSEATRQ
jgi:SAM-dependent methyltransferase